MNNSYENVKNIVNELHDINFKRIIQHKNITELEQDDFTKYCDFRGKIIDYCDKCDREKSYAPREKREQYFKLNNISHGTHSFDFLHSFGKSNKEIEGFFENGWRDEPVLFLMENPSVEEPIKDYKEDWKLYDYVDADVNKNGKRPAANWYWIHGDKKKEFKDKYFDGDRFFVQSQYGNMVAALIYQFKLGNAYLTNLVKCGISDARFEDGKFVETGYRNLDEYSDDCKRTCIRHILLEEIKALCKSDDGLRPLRIFAFGDRPYRYVQDFLKNCEENLNLKYKLYQLPHPASREKNIYRKYILKGALAESFQEDIRFESSVIPLNNKPEYVERVLKDVFKEIPLGNRTTNNICSLNLNKHKSLFVENEIVDEVWIKGKVKSQFQWGMGYVFATKDYWYWNYDKEENAIKNDIPYYELFEEAINILNGEK